MNKTLKIFAVIFVCLFLFVSLSGVGLAEPPSGDPPEPPSGDPGEPPSGDITCPSGVTCVDNPLAGRGSLSSPIQIIGRITNALVAPVGAVAFLFFIVGGFYWIFSGGNDEKIKRGKDIMMWALLGIVIIFTSYAMVRFLLKVVIGP